MANTGKKLRLNRIIHPKRKSLIVAFDHALILGPIDGMLDPGRQFRRFAECRVDGILMNFGMINAAAESVLVGNPPAILVRLDWTSLWTAGEASGNFVSRALGTVEQALRAGADAVVIYQFVGTGNAEFEADQIARNSAVARECEALGVPLIVESLARGAQVKDPRAAEWMNLHARIAAEFGADAVKTEYTGSPDSMAEVVKNCPIPVLVLGGARQGSDEDALAIVDGAVAAGVAGVILGRNVFQSETMAVFLQRARSILDGGISMDEVAAGAADQGEHNLIS